MLGIFQDYFDIVKQPMDLSTIKRKLDAGQYNNPWEVSMNCAFCLFVNTVKGKNECCGA